MPPAIAPLLSTKLNIPQARSNLVSRPRLHALLTAGQAQPLTLILAPPGSGKTTLLADWIAGHRRRVAWLALDAGDNDFVRFWSIFIASLQTAHENLGVEALTLLRTAPAPAWDIVVSWLLNDLAAVSDPFVCVLEDYHCINQDLIHAALAFLIDHQPENMRLIITSRSDPPLPVARWRMRHQLVEIRAEDLRFTLGEARDFLIRTMKLKLSTRDVAALEERTEGWIAGLQLAALSLQGQPDTAACIAAFSGQHRYVADYLFEEVVKCQPVEIQSFLVQTSLLNRLCGSLCAAVLDQPSSAGVLRQLEQLNLFITPLDTERQWYRYHSLFAEFLRQQLGQRYPDHSALLHRRASLWHEQQGFKDEAIDHALAARDFDRAAALIQTSAEDWIRQGEVTTLLDRLAALPDQIICAKPELCTWQAWALTLSHQVTKVEPWLRRSEVRFLEM